LETELSRENHLTWFDGYITREDREKLHGHRGAVIWFTGLSASGKSTIAHHLEKMLYEAGCSTYVFDGDNVRHGLCCDLGFSPEQRVENIRRIGEMARLFVDAGIIAVTAFISPYRKDREKIKDLVGKESFFEVYVQCPIDVCAERDQKGIYAKAKERIIKEFTGISAPYEPPEKPSLVIASNLINPIESADFVVNTLRDKNIIP
jgi:adenylylsulfate kinase